MRRVLYAVAAGTVAGVATGAETWRRGYAAPIMFGGCAWADAIFGYRPTATDEPEVTT